MGDNGSLFEVEPFIVEEPTPENLSADRKRTLRRKQMMESGIHPATRVPLLGSNTCANCAHCVLSDRWWKCDLVPITGGAGTDIRKSWPACIKFTIGS